MPLRNGTIVCCLGIRICRWIYSYTGSSSTRVEPCSYAVVKQFSHPGQHRKQKQLDRVTRPLYIIHKVGLTNLMATTINEDGPLSLRELGEVTGIKPGQEVSLAALNSEALTQPFAEAPSPGQVIRMNLFRGRTLFRPPARPAVINAWEAIGVDVGIPGSVWVVFADSQYVYLGHNGGKHLTVLKQSDWSIVEGTPQLPAVVFGVYADSDFVYVGHRSFARFSVITRGQPDGSGWLIVQTGLSFLPGDGRSIYADSQYVYIGHEGGNGFRVVNKGLADGSGWSNVPLPAFLPENGFGYGVHADEEFVYIAHSRGNRFTVLNKGNPDGSNWFKINIQTEILPDLGGNTRASGVYVDKSPLPPSPAIGQRHVYIAADGGRVVVRGRADGSRWSIIRDKVLQSSLGGPIDVHADTRHIYMARGELLHVANTARTWQEGGSFDFRFVIPLKGPSSAGNRNWAESVYAHGKVVYVGHRNAPFLTAVGLP